MAKVLIVDDERGMRLSLSAFLKNEGHDVRDAEDVSSALEVLEGYEADVVVSDIIMPGRTGVQLLGRIQELDRGISVVLLTGEPNVETASAAVRQGAFDYLAKPINKAALIAVVARAARAKEQHDLNLRLSAENNLYRSNLEGLVETRTAELSAALKGTIGVITQILGTRDPYTAGHQRRVASLSRAIADELGLDDELAEGIEMAALVHDVGKISVPAEILSKPTRLSTAEFDLIKDHSQVGYEILSQVTFPWPIADVIQQHHERLDGSGYPNGLKGDAVRSEARIIAVADVVEAMASHRPYRASLGIDVALEEITRLRGIAFDPEVVDACVHLFSSGNYQLES
jgi:putative two-component system response regulator